MSEKIKDVFKPAERVLGEEASLLYTQLEDGTFHERAELDIYYPPGTKFYTKNIDGGFDDANIVIGPDLEAADTPAPMTHEHMVDTSAEFLRQHGYVVFHESEAQAPAPGSDVPSRSTREINEHLFKLHHLISAHCPPHAIVEGHQLIAEIKAVL